MSVFADKKNLVMSLHQNGNENSKMFTLNSPRVWDTVNNQSISDICHRRWGHFTCGDILEILDANWLLTGPGENDQE